ncbi:T9SS type A sorting domain-containing protein [Niastella caeni]|uniref:T9SS type A sorting domain-containing protein n=1 Tax=Niastella caeni TaxID=2569763 RepID=A0A4S8HPI4_9BACT|nr:T9SS type A sorting domain-containing protein [Niastella caeni]THU37320.1 T9SS type A sorting domain-containing protein [Niastella caeni]
MKSIYTTLFALLMATSLMAGSIKSKSNNWNLTGTWNLNRLPANGDSIIIPADSVVTLDQLIDLDNVVVIIYGTLDLENGKLRLNSASRIIIYSGGKITGVNSNDQIKIGSDIKFKGTQLVQTGYSYADNTTGNGFSAGATLPVVFQSFYITRQGSNNQLSWSTSEEVNNNYYAIEKSTDARNWKQIAVIMGAGTSSLVNKYAYTDKNSADAVVYYRIRQVDMNGSAFYSAIRSLRNNANSQVTNIFASSNKTVTIDFNSDVRDNVSIQLINMSGQVIVRKDFNQASYRLIVNAMSAGSGVYAVRVSDSKGWSEVKKIAL